MHKDTLDGFISLTLAYILGESPHHKNSFIVIDLRR